eukprot:146382-Prorocentrum_minimum.AAC.1
MKKDTDRDFFLGAHEAVEYGVIDHVVENERWNKVRRPLVKLKCLRRPLTKRNKRRELYQRALGRRALLWPELQTPAGASEKTKKNRTTFLAPGTTPKGREYTSVAGTNRGREENIGACASVGGERADAREAGALEARSHKRVLTSEWGTDRAPRGHTAPVQNVHGRLHFAGPITPLLTSS